MGNIDYIQILIDAGWVFFDLNYDKCPDPASLLFQS